MKTRQRITSLLPMFLIVAGCTSVNVSASRHKYSAQLPNVPPPTYLNNAHPGQTGLVYVFDMAVKDGVAQPSLESLSASFAYRKFTEKDLADCKTGIDFMGKYYQSIVKDGLPVKDIGCAALPEGEYYAIPNVAGYSHSGGALLDALKSGTTASERYENLLAHGSARFRSEVGKAAIVWVQEYAGDQTDKSLNLKTEMIGTIADPNGNPAKAQDELIAWVVGDVLARQYIAVLLLSKVGDPKAIVPLQELALREPRITELAQKGLAEIERRIGLVVPPAEVLKAIPKAATPSIPARGAAVEYTGTWDFYLVGAAAPSLVVFRGPECYFGFDSKQSTLPAEFSTTHFSDMKGLSGRYVNTISIDGTLLGDEVLRTLTTNAQGRVSLVEISEPLTVAHSGTNRLGGPIEVQVLEDVRPLFDTDAPKTGRKDTATTSAITSDVKTANLGRQNGDMQCEEVIVKLPSALRSVEFPSGSDLTLDLRDITIEKGMIKLELTIEPALPNSESIGISVFYLTRYASEVKPGEDATTAAGLVELWKKSLAVNASMKGLGSMVTGGGRLESKLGGVADFIAETSSDGKVVKARGQLPIQMDDLAPQSIGVVAIKNGIPISNFIWVPIGQKPGALNRVRVKFDAEQNAGFVVTNNMMAVDNSLTWDMWNKSLPKTHKESVDSLAISANGKLLASSGTEAPFYEGPIGESIKLWSIADGRLIMRLIGHRAKSMASKSIAFCPGRRMLAYGEDGTGIIKLIGLPDGKLVASITATTLKGLSIGLLAISPDGKHLVSSTGAYDQEVKIWSFPEGTLLQTIKNDQFVRGLAISPDSQLLAIGSSDIPGPTGKSADNAVNLWKISDGSKVATLPVGANTKADIYCVTFSPDGKYLVGGGGIDSELLCVWSLPDGKLLRQPLDGAYGKPSRTIYCLALSPDGTLLASGSHDGTITVRTFPGCKVVGTMKGHGESQIYSVYFSQSGKTLASFGNDDRVCLWELDGEKRCWLLYDTGAGDSAKESTRNE